MFGVVIPEFTGMQKMLQPCRLTGGKETRDSPRSTEISNVKKESK
jgi:hypothetical protein